ncbi:MAG: HD domain-containing protein [Dehalococcoidia bacterium]|nr:HD domain-containing protein [Dehalococcoidia bacterium]
MAETEPPSLFLSPDNASGPNAARGVLVSALSARGSADRLRQLAASGVLTALIPEIETLKGVVQPKEHFWDVYGHSLETVAAVEFVVDKVCLDWPEANLGSYLSACAESEISRLIGLKLAGLLHDVAKPQTKFIEPQGKMHFFGHAALGAAIACSALSRLGFSLIVQGMVSLMIEHHLRPGFLTTRPDSPSDRSIYRFFRDTAGVGIETLLLNLADHKAMRGPLLLPSEWQEHLDRTRDIMRRYHRGQLAKKPSKLIDGLELMAKLGLTPCPLVGKLLLAIEMAQDSGEVSSKEEAIAVAERLLAGEDFR